MRNLNDLNKYRDRVFEHAMGWEPSDDKRAISGCFMIPTKETLTCTI